MNNWEDKDLIMASEVVFEDYTLPKMQQKAHIWKQRRQKVFFTECFAEEISACPGPVYFEDANSA